MTAPVAPSPRRARFRVPWLHELAAVVLLLIVTTLTFTRANHLESVEDWNVPLAFSGDALGITAMMVAAVEPDAHFPFASQRRLGAPLGANWADLPSTEDLWAWLGGRCLRVVGLGATLNGLFLLAALWGALAMYACARSMRAHPVAAGLAGLLYGLCPFLFSRSVQHLTLALSGCVPLALLAWRHLGDRGRWRHPERRPRPFWLLAVAALEGAQMVYYPAYFLLGLALVVAVQARRRAWAAMRWGVATAAVTVLVAGALTADTLALRLREGPNADAVVRSPWDARIVGLWPEQLFVPGGFHRFGWVREALQPWGARTGGRGEWPNPYLGVVGGLSLLGAVGTGLVRLARRRREGPAVRTLGFVLFWVALALPVGVLALVARFTGVGLLRSNNRVSVILLAIALAWLATRLTRWLHRRPRAVLPAVAIGLAAFGLWEQIPLTDLDVDPGARVALRAAVTSAEAVAQTLEAETPRPRVFVYPPAEFPEDPHPPFGDPYLPLQLYVSSRSAEWSFGGVRGRPAGRWPFEVTRGTPEAFAAALVAQGFTGLATHPAGCAEPGCQSFLDATLARLPPTRRVEPLQGGWTAWSWAASAQPALQARPRTE